METTILLESYIGVIYIYIYGGFYWGHIGVIRNNGKENGNYYIVILFHSYYHYCYWYCCYYSY